LHYLTALIAAVALKGKEKGVYFGSLGCSFIQTQRERMSREKKGFSSSNPTLHL